MGSTNMYIVIKVITQYTIRIMLLILLFGWPPCQRSNLTLVDVPQLAYCSSCIRGIWLFVYSRTLCKPDMVLVYVLLNKLCPSLSLLHSDSSVDIRKPVICQNAMLK